MTRKNTIIAALLGGVLLTGCQTTADRGVELPQASAVPETVRADMPVDPRDNGLTWAQQDLLSAVASEYKAVGHGPLVISYPQGAGNQDAAMQAIADARTFLYEHGINWRQITGGAYDARGRSEADVVFSFTRYRAVQPEECDEGRENLSIEYANDGYSTFGCAMAANLAAMIADPRDLIAPRTMGAPDTERRQTVLDGYRRGESTASQTSDRESGTVSNVRND